MREIEIAVNGQSLRVSENTTVAAAIALAGVVNFRRSVTGEPRGPLCGMGVCFECRVTINGLPNMRSCQTLCADGMEINSYE